MARIIIADLPPVENMTPEEMEAIIGAGRFSFRPEFEALESREMMDAGMGFALQTMLIQSPGMLQAGHQAGMVKPYNPVAETGMFGAAVHKNEAPMMTSQSGQVADLRNMGVVDALNKGSNWILYEPVTSSSGAYVSKDQIKSELQFLYDKGFRGIVTYAFNNGREEIPVIAKQIGFHQVIAGLWCSGGAFAGEKANLTAERMQAIDGYCVGNETQLRRVANDGDRGLSIADLKSMVQQIKDLSGKPVATSDAWDLYGPGARYVPELMNVGDWVFPNMHPWYEQGWAPAHQDPSKALDFMTNVINENFNGKTGGKAFILHEAWWPSANEGAYQPGTGGNQWQDEHNYFGAGSPEHQKNFFQGLTNKGFKFVYGEAFDQSWKKEGDAAYQGNFAKHWGLWSGVNGNKSVGDVINYGYRSGAQSQAPQNLQAMDQAFESMSPQRSLSQIAVDQVWTVSGNMQDHRVKDIKLDSTTTVGNDIQIDVTFEMESRKRTPVSQRVTFVLTNSGKEQRGDTWTLKSLSQDTTSSFQFNEQSLEKMRGALKRILVPAR